MKRFVLPIAVLIILLLTVTSSALAKDGEGHNKEGNSAKGRNEHRQKGNGHHGGGGGGHGRHHGHHGHRHRPSWGFGLWAPPMYPYGGGYYQPYYAPAPIAPILPPQPYIRPYGGYYRNGDFGFFFNF
jgi:hypothetical protein